MSDAIGYLEVGEDGLPIRRQRSGRRSTPFGALVPMAFLGLILSGLAVSSYQALVAEPAMRAIVPGGDAAAAAAAIPRDAPPPVEPAEVASGVAPDQARLINAEMPFSTGPLLAARPFVFSGTPLDLQRATACLAAAVLYEAGDDAVGQRAVAQVVLNRVRHPAFPKTVCGVVFQGSERTTGCQFTFTCDGALGRTVRLPALQRAGLIAAAALHGGVDPAVGLATHYHTDWVVPRWSREMNKIAQVETHLFYRWQGLWGGAGAFTGARKGSEPVEPKLAGLFSAHLFDAAAGDEAAAAAAADAALVTASDAVAVAAVVNAEPVPLPGDPDVFFTTFARGTSADDYLALAERACGHRSRCMFIAWLDPSLTPKALPASTFQLQSSAFQYVRDPTLSSPRVHWNCSLAALKGGRNCTAIPA